MTELFAIDAEARVQELDVAGRDTPAAEGCAGVAARAQASFMQQHLFCCLKNHPEEECGCHINQAIDSD